MRHHLFLSFSLVFLTTSPDSCAPDAFSSVPSTNCAPKQQEKCVLWREQRRTTTVPSEANGDEDGAKP
eukprot:2053832-Pleurochrysis_carterae.AAC.1